MNFRIPPDTSDYHCNLFLQIMIYLLLLFVLFNAPELPIAITAFPITSDWVSRTPSLCTRCSRPPVTTLQFQDVPAGL